MPLLALLAIATVTVLSYALGMAILRRSDTAEEITVREAMERAHKAHARILEMQMRFNLARHERALKALAGAGVATQPEPGRGAILASEYSAEHRELLLVGVDGSKLVSGVSPREAAMLRSGEADTDQLTGWLLRRTPAQVSDAGFGSLDALGHSAKDAGYIGLAHSRRASSLVELDQLGVVEAQLHSDENCTGDHLWLLGTPVDPNGGVRSVWHFDRAHRTFVPPTPRYVVRAA